MFNWTQEATAMVHGRKSGANLGFQGVLLPIQLQTRKTTFLHLNDTFKKLYIPLFAEKDPLPKLQTGGTAFCRGWTRITWQQGPLKTIGKIIGYIQIYSNIYMVISAHDIYPIPQNKIEKRRGHTSTGLGPPPYRFFSRFLRLWASKDVKNYMAKFETRRTG